MNSLLIFIPLLHSIYGEVVNTEVQDRKFNATKVEVHCTEMIGKFPIKAKNADDG